MPSLPRWVRAVLAVDRGVAALARLEALVRDEVLLACLPAAGRDAVTEAIYAAQPTYNPGGNAFARSLHDWERRALARPPFPSHGRLLLGGAGGGRELAELCGLGYSVLAFEPCAPLADAARCVAAAHPGASVVQAAYGDLVEAVAHGRGPLAECLAESRTGPAFDGVVLGWGSLSHVTVAEERAALFRALRSCAPRAPVLASAMPRVPAGTRLDRLRPPLRRVLQRLGAPGIPAPGDRFVPWAGFVAGFGPGDFEALAASAGYTVAWSDLSVFPHAVMVPVAATGGATG